MDQAALGKLLASARCVMFDFDGPIADLFAGRPSALRVAVALREHIGSWDTGPTLLPTLTRPYNPLQVLRDLAGRESGERIAELEKVLAAQEELAAGSAEATPYAAALVVRLVALGKTVTVTTNNSAGAAARYLERAGLERVFRQHIHGRAANPELLKPNPHCLREALDTARRLAAAELEPDECLMIGDSSHDFLAASRLGITFLGYAKDPRKWRDLERANARNIVDSLECVLRAAPEA